MSGLVGHRGLLLGTGGGSVVSAAAAILAAMRSWWSLDENAASPTYADSHGSNDLTVRTGGSTTNTSDVSTATSKAGRAFNCARTDNRSAYIPRSNTALDMPNADFSFGGWFRLGADVDTAAFIMGRVGDATTTAIQAYMYIENNANLRAAASTDGTISGRVVANTGLNSGGWSDSQYGLAVLTFNRTANQIEIRFRRPGYIGGALTKAVTAFPDPLYTASNNSNFTISEGLRSDTNFFTSNRSAVVMADECFFVDKAITDAEMDYLYNGGSGKTYAQLVSDAA